MRFNKRFVDKVIDQAEIVTLIKKYLGESRVRRTKKNYVALCPFHSERTPSFSISPDKQICYCFGCGAGGNVIGFVKEYEGISYAQAVIKVMNIFGIKGPDGKTNHVHSRRRDRGKTRRFRKSKARIKEREKTATRTRRRAPCPRSTYSEDDIPF